MESSFIASSGVGDGKGIAAGDIVIKDGESDCLGEGVESESVGEDIWEKTWPATAAWSYEACR